MTRKSPSYVDWGNVGKGLVLGISALYGATRVSDYAIEQIQQRLDRLEDQFKETRRIIEMNDAAQDVRTTREFDQLRHDVNELRDRDSKRAR